MSGEIIITLVAVSLMVISVVIWVLTRDKKGEEIDIEKESSWWEKTIDFLCTLSLFN